MTSISGFSDLSFTIWSLFLISLSNVIYSSLFSFMLSLSFSYSFSSFILVIKFRAQHASSEGGRRFKIKIIQKDDEIATEESKRATKRNTESKKDLKGRYTRRVRE